MFTHLDLFSGIGGFALAAKWAGFETVAFCEINPFCRKVLKKHWPHVLKYMDVKDVANPDHVDLLTAGFPCQPFSIAGKKKGYQDERNLWPETYRIIKISKPTWIVLENVLGIVPHLDAILEDLEREHYSAQTYIIPASAVGAPHKRERIWIVANSNYGRCDNGFGDWQERFIQSDIKRYIETIQSEWTQFVPKSWETFNAEDFLKNSQFNRQQDQPPFPGVDDGLPNGLDRNKSLGNAIVPQVVYPILKFIYFFLEKDMDDKNRKAFSPQVEPQIGLTVEKYTEAKDKIFNKEQELFYRATDYRGS